MGIRSIIAGLFQRRERGEDDSEHAFVAASSAYQAAFNNADPFTSRGLEANESSPFILEQAEFDAHLAAVVSCQERLAALKEAFNQLSGDSPFQGKAGELYSLACNMQESSLDSFHDVALKTAIAALKRQFNERQRTISGESQATSSIERLKALAASAEAAVDAVEDMLIDVGVWRNFARLVSETRK